MVGRTKPRKLAQGPSDHIGRDYLPLADLFKTRIFAELARRGYADLREGHQFVFINIEDEGSTLTELAASAGLSKQAVHEIVSDLERRGYIKRIPSLQDRRSKLIRTTDKAERAIEAAWDAIAQIEREWKAVLGATKFKMVRSSLKTLHAFYQEHE